jgi:hypothetical protein
MYDGNSNMVTEKVVFFNYHMYASVKVQVHVLTSTY